MSKQILVIDDERTMLNLVSIMLRRHGYTITQAHNGFIAIELLEKTVPDLIVCDIMMPGINGIDLTAHVRKSPHFDQTPIIMLSALRDTDSVDRAFKAGANGFLVKSMLHRELMPIVHKWLYQVHNKTI